ncbi:myb-like protein D [Diaphorina citri]|uniref:Myb-like protein D n=1 Tax=Diaphorina citri TaxID=121845 RepID=A0A3Q0IRN2_DIACI|nr:myb-like protein D [Diaphorina citri]
MNTNPDMGTQTETTLASEIVDRRENQAKKQRDPMMNDNVNNNNNIKTQHFQLIQEMRNIQNQTKREVSGGVREHKTNEEMKSQTREINKTNLNEINKNIKTKSDKEDNKVTKSGKLQEIHKESEYVLEHEESKQTKLHKQYNLQKHVLKTQATIEHVETVHENKESNANVSVRNEHDTRIHRRINMHHRHASISQNISSSHAELFPIVAKPNEKIIKILDSSHFVITKDSLLNKPHDVQSEMDNSQLNRECGREQIQIISHKRQDTNKEDRIQDNLERKPNVEPTIINNNNVDPCEYESMAHEILRSIDNIQSKETQEKYEKIDEEIDVDHGKTIATSRTLRVNKPGVHETHLTDNEQVERAELQLSVRNLQTQVEIRQHSTIPQDETNVENKKKTNKSSEENIQEEQSGNIRSSLQETDQSVKLYEKQIDLSTKQYQIQQARSPPEQQATQYQHSAMRGVRTSASTVTKLSKSSIQEDMLEIWLDHQKFLQRHPEDDSFYSFMFVFFAVFASFVFVLIVYFVMFVV